jgi:hypothetical protein
MKIKPTELKTLVFSGAGALGVAYSGCVNALSELGALENIKTLGGSSAGSIISYAIALGLTPKEIETEILEHNFGEFLNCPGANLQSILTEKGYAKKHKAQTAIVLARLNDTNAMSTNTAVKRFLKELWLKTYKKSPTFKQLYDKTGQTLVITGCDIGTRQEKYNSWETAPDMLVEDAVLASMSIPMVFPPVKLYANEDACVIDGGTLNNLPVNIGQGTPSLYIVIGEPITKQGKFTETSGFFDFLSHLTQTILNNPYQYIFSIPAIVEKTIQVEIPPGLGALSFDMEDSQKWDLINNGYNAILKYFHPRIN